MSFKTYYSGLIGNHIDAQRSGKNNLIFVHWGQADLIDHADLGSYIVDRETFGVDAGDEVFNREWFNRVFVSLQEGREYHLLSLAQFSYLIFYISPSFFEERVVVLRDNLRQLFPIKKEDYLEKSDAEDIEVRPDELPIYQAEQVAINGKYYYSAKNLDGSFKECDVFLGAKELITTDNKDLMCVDVSSDPYSLDEFVGDCVGDDSFNQNVVARFSEKQQQSPLIIEILKRLNALLADFGGSISVLKDEPVEADYRASDEIQELLARYWGEGAGFRDISVYRNPNVSSEVVPLSQGFVVETLIREYDNSVNGVSSRDLFLTAPTGAGKSLLFQLPAFYVSEKHDVTIVVSPLIALMKDQVEAIKKDRGYDKVAYINSELNLSEREGVIEGCKLGCIDILYMSPELLLSYDISYFIGDRRLGLLVIDEAHLITTWGRDFRVDYWFLGSHIRKMRKYNSLDFPMVAVTATAIYGGANDMVFDSIDSLAMHNPHVFIGDVKRDNIEFLVNTYETFPGNYESNKILQTVEFIKKIAGQGLKTLVYAPYTRHVRKILAHVNADIPGAVTGYYGSLDPLEKEYAYRLYRSSERRIMVSTKAFGMGVDIPGIQVVYHHAPSGLLPDYVQEIGRVARKPEMKGYAALNYSSQDQRYTRALHGMSALRQYQIKAVLQKIHNTYLLNKKSRNLLLSVDDFGHIFSDALDLDQKLLTALMMIEKDYLAKSRFNVIIARPKKLFVKVYARVSHDDLAKLSARYPRTYSVVSGHGGDRPVVCVDLDQLWRLHFSDKSFPVIKRHFYSGALLKDADINFIPQLKVSYVLADSYTAVSESLHHYLGLIQKVFAGQQGFFENSDLKQAINTFLNDNDKSEKLTRFILSSYSGVQIGPSEIDVNAFLQKRRGVDGMEYRLFGARYLACFSALENLLHQIFNGSGELRCERFVTNSQVNTADYIRLGFFLEILQLGSFEVVGGENPMVFIRINDPDRVKRDSVSPSYKNLLLDKTLQRHNISNQIYDHFFLREFSNTERWGFIEDYFLGLDLDSLLLKYQGRESIQIDIIEFLRNQNLPVPVVNGLDSDEGKTDVNVFYPTPDKFYLINDPLTISDGGTLRTQIISEWLNSDPVALDVSKRSTPFSLDDESYKILMSKLRANHPDYLKDVLGLKTMIEFNGFRRPVSAAVPYRTRPVQFYQWWCADPERVNMTEEEMIHLFRKVHQLRPSALKAKHRKMI